MIQSSQPISLKFTWSRRRLHRAPLAAGARRILLLSWPDLALISLKKAFSLLLLPGRANPRARRSTGRPPLSSWFCWILKPLKTFHMSNTSHLLPNPPPPCRSSTVLVCSRAAGCLPEAQVYTAADPKKALRGSDRRFLRMRNSAPRSPSRSRDWGPRSSAREDTDTKAETRKYESKLRKRAFRSRI
uniref:Uncharacterized protein n=1 Tax=Labrus bergylta TaxID=56723 RepID=A0A3Q3G6E9_9LABR